MTSCLYIFLNVNLNSFFRMEINLKINNHLSRIPQNDIPIQNLLHFKEDNYQYSKKQKNRKHDFNVIKHTRKVIKTMTQKQRFKKAKNHFYDALYNRRPRLQTFSELPQCWITTLQIIQSSKIWETFLYLLAYFYMYLVIPDPHQNFFWMAIVQGTLLAIFWIDILLSNYRQVNQKISLISNMQNRFYLKICVFLALFVDFILFLCFYKKGARVIRIFGVFRGILPIFFDTITRKNFYALMSAVKDIFVFLIFYALVIFSFTVIGNQFIIVQEGVNYDNYTQNYGDLGKFIFVMYVMSTYDSYPDNQLLAIQHQNYIYGLLIIFVLLNVFVFVNIPTTIIYNSFKDTRSKIILIDQLKQQHSLILAFVSLGQENLTLQNEKLIRFLLYLYRNKIEYLNAITQICLKLDNNHTGNIQVSQFMQISKIIQEKQSMMPPSFYDLQWWLQFRKYVNKKLNLKQIFKSWKTELAITILVALVCINSFLYIFTGNYIFKIIDYIVAIIYFVQIVSKIIAFGIQQFFVDRWNNLDFYIVLITAILQAFQKTNIPHNSEVMIKIFRAFRISYFFELFSAKQDIKCSSTISRKIKQLFGQTAIIIPVILRFFSLIIIFYYILGIIGMQVLYAIYEVPASQSPYSSYDQFSNFRTFIGSQIVFVQVLVQAGWSMVAFDHAFRSKGYYEIVMVYFVLCHIIIVIILTSLFKGIVWQVYFAVDDQYKKRLITQIQIIDESQKMALKKRQYEQIHQKVQNKQMIFPTTIVKRQIIENKIDLQIFKKLKNIYQKKDRGNSSNMDRIMLVSHLIKEKDLQLKDFKNNRHVKDDQEEAQFQGFYDRIMAHNVKNFSNLQYVEEVDFQQKMENLLSKIILNPKIQYSQTMVYPKMFVQFLTFRCKNVKNHSSVVDFDLNKNILLNSQSIKFHTNQLKQLLQIQKSGRVQKLKIAQHMVNEGLLTQQQVKKQFQKKQKEDSYNIQVNHIMRKVFLHDTNEELIQKFQLQYFSNIYGQKFRQINKIRLEPLLRYEAMLMYNFKNILRYAQIENNDFFQILATIENSFSNKLLKKGSLFKFVYQLDSLSDTWFTVQYSHQKEVIIHFLKTGIWVYNKNQQEEQIYHGKDVFNWDLSKIAENQMCEKFMKLFFQSFQTIALSQIDQKTFFKTNPEDTVYDLFFFFINLAKQQNTQSQQNKLKISKIMLVILSKEEQRENEQQLPYELTDINEQIQSTKPNYEFKIDQGQNETFLKLKNMSVLDQQKIIETDGLPFSYIVNLMTEIKQTLQLHCKRMTKQVQKVLNSSFQQVLLTQTNQKSQKNIKQRRVSKRISSQLQI